MQRIWSQKCEEGLTPFLLFSAGSPIASNIGIQLRTKNLLSLSSGKLWLLPPIALMPDIDSRRRWSTCNRSSPANESFGDFALSPASTRERTDRTTWIGTSWRATFGFLTAVMLEPPPPDTVEVAALGCSNVQLLASGTVATTRVQLTLKTQTWHIDLQNLQNLWLPW